MSFSPESARAGRGLGPRLSAIASLTLAGAPVADLCCDHGKLAAALVASGRAPRAIAADLRREPLVGARRRLTSLGLEQRVELRRGDGFAVLTPGEVATAILAGIGAPLAERLLVAGDAAGHLAGLRRLVVQPNHGYPKLGPLRARLDALGWDLVDERVAAEGGRLYVILVAEPSGRRPAAALRDDLDLDLGPRLRRRSDPLTRAWFAREADRLATALERASAAPRGRRELLERALLRFRRAGS